MSLNPLRSNTTIGIFLFRMNQKKGIKKMNHVEERGISFTVKSGLRSVRNSLMDYAQDTNAYVAGLNIMDYVDPDERDCSEGFVLYGQAGILEGMKYPMYGRYTCWNVQIILIDSDPGRNGECEVILVAIGDKRLGNNLSIRCSEEHRNKIENYLNDCFYCTKSARIF